MPKLKGLFVLDAWPYEAIYGPDERRDIARHVDLVAPAQISAAVLENPAVLREVELIFSGWGGPTLDSKFLDAAPQLKVVLYGAGAASGIVTEAAWARGVQVTTAYIANAVPVAEYTLAAILFSLKRAWSYALGIKRTGQWMRPAGPVPGAYGSTVGLISLGAVGRLTLDLLKHFDLKLLVHDPFLSASQAQELGVELVTLSEIFQRSDVISLHTPWLKETEGLITGAHLASMKPGAAFINTARGAVVREIELIEIARQRPDLQFILDVTHPEPPVAGSPLYTLPNVVLTPHIAGSMDHECRRMGRYMVDELERYVRGEPLKWLVTPELAAHSTHRPK